MESDLEREWAFCKQLVDPAVHEALALKDPWQAYHRTLEMLDLLTDVSPSGSWELPHAGGVYRSWAMLTDLYETSKTSIDEAHATLRGAATRWLERPTAPTADFIEQWLLETDKATADLFKRDGDWWHKPE